MVQVKPEVQTFGSYLESRGKAASTVVSYTTDVQQFLEFIDRHYPTLDYRAIEARHVASFLLQLQTRNQLRATRARKRSAIWSFFEFAHNRGWVNTNPVTQVPQVQVPHRAQPPRVSASDIDYVYESISGTNPKAIRDKAMLALLRNTGIKPTELVLLDLASMDLDAAIATCATGRRNSDGTPRVRRVVFDEETRKALKLYIDRARPLLSPPKERDRSPLFFSYRGERLTRQGLWLILRNRAESVGSRPFTPRDLRHCFALRLREGGCSNAELQRRLGHVSAGSTTNLYGPRQAPVAVG